MKWVFDSEGTSILTVSIIKENSRQDTDVKIPRKLVEEDVAKAWADQNQDWLRLAAQDIPAVPHVSSHLYFGSRVLHFERHQKSLMWNLLHFDQMPYDAFTFVPMTTDMVRRIREMNAY